MTATIDQQFVEYIVRSLVSNPDAVSVARSVDDKGVLLELTVDPNDLGRVIGKRGGTAQSLRTLLRALGTKNEQRYNLKIIDNGPNDSHGDSISQDASRQSTPTDKNDIANNQTDSSSSISDADNANDTVAAEDSSAAQDNPERSHTSDVVNKTRQELADLDDLDI